MSLTLCLSSRLVPALLLLVVHTGCTVSPPPGNGNVDEPIELPTDGTVTTIAGTGTPGFSGEGGRSTDAQLDRPMDLVVTSDGLILIADFNNHRIRQVDLTTGKITTIAGNGQTTGDGALNLPTDVTALSGGGFLAVAWGGHQVFEYATDEPRTLLAGDGTASCFADLGQLSGPDQPLFAPRSSSILADNSVLVSEQSCHRLLRVRPDGSVETYAGTGEPGYAGDDGDAVDAMLQAGAIENGPSLGIALSPEDPPDELFIADTLNHVVRVVKPFTGRIETFVGTGIAGFTDGAPEAAEFNHPTNVYLPSDHSLWIVDSGNHAIRYVDSLRLSVSTVAGTGTPGFNGDGLPAEETRLNNPCGVFVTREGDVFIADTDNHRIRHFR